MNKRTISVALQIPKKYKWVARQPFGTIMAFTKKPRIVEDEAEPGVKFWGIQSDEYEITDCGEMGGDWQNSLIKL